MTWPVTINRQRYPVPGLPRIAQEPLEPVLAPANHAKDLVAQIQNVYLIAIPASHHAIRHEAAPDINIHR